MSEQIKHECGIALLRLLKPLEYYQQKYGNAWALNRMYLLMEKQHNRGQDGAGLANIKFDTNPGEQYINITKSNSNQPIQDVFAEAFRDMRMLQKEEPEKSSQISWLKKNARFTGELFIGHLRYGTFGKNELENLHPFLRENNWKTRNLVLAGNFNLTNIDEMLSKLITLGQHPVKVSDTAIILEKIGKFLDREVERLFKYYKLQGLSNIEISERIAEDLNIASILTSAAKRWDGGYVMAGAMGHGDAFVLRDENGIRPCFYYVDEEIAVVASERPVIMTTFNVPLTKVKELASTSESSLSSSLIEAENNLTKLSSELSLKFESASRTVFSEIDEARRQFEQSHDKQKALIQSEEENYVDKCREDLRTAMDSEVSRVSAIFDSMVQTSTEQLGNFTRKLTEIKEAVSMLNQGMSESLSRTSEKISQIQSRLTNSEASLSDTQNKVTIAKEELFNLQKEHKSLTDEVTRARKELDSLRLQAQNAKRERQDEEARLVKLQMEAANKAAKSAPAPEPAPAASSEAFVGDEEEIPLDED